jgi:uncharacterized protein (DUF58 family)
MGLGVVIMTLLIALAAINTGTNLLYLMIALLLSFCVLSATHGRFNMARLQIERAAPAETHADRPVEIEFAVTNRKRWMAAYGIAVREMGSSAAPAREGERAEGFFLSIPPRRTARRRVEVKFPRRGIVRLERLTAVSSFPFGFLDFSLSLWSEAEVLVYPKLLPVESILEGSRPEPGRREVSRRGLGISLHAIRDYVPGDPARAIHWRLSAKGGGIKVREFEHEEGKKIRLAFDFRAPETPDEARIEEFERGLSLIASLAKHFIDDGYEVGLWTRAGTVPQGVGVGHLRRIMRALALAEIESFTQGGDRPPTQLDCADVWISGRKVEKTAVKDGIRVAVHPKIDETEAAAKVRSEMSSRESESRVTERR